MASVNDTKYSFDAEWYDEVASLIRKFLLHYFPEDGTIVLYDVKNRKTFLKRSRYDAIQLEDLVVGNTITVYARHLNIVGYADDFTKNKLGRSREHTLALIKPDAYVHSGKIIDAIYSAGFVVARMKMFALRPEEARAFYSEHSGKPFFDDLVEFMCSDAIIALELVGEQAIAKWRRLMGPTDVEEAKASAPNSIRAQFGHNVTANAVHGSDGVHSARKELQFFFGSRTFAPTAVFDNCTLCIIKPHSVLVGDAGKVVDSILAEGYEVSALEMFALDKANAEEFLEVYKGVVPEYPGMVEQLISGPSIVMEIRAENAVQSFREFCGPADPEVAGRIRPGSLRAQYGVDKLKNAVHCTDLPEDGILESEYFFKILQ